MTLRERTWLVSLVCVFALLYSLYGLFRHWHFGSSAYDLGIVDQVVWHLSRFETPSSSVRGFPHFLGDHFFPILALFAPLYWIAPGPETLIVAQAALFAASMVPVFAFARGRLATTPAFAITLAYALFWGIQQSIAFDVHETGFGALFIGLGLLALDRRRWTWFWLLMGALVFVKEDMLPLLTCFGVLLVVQGERRRGIMLIAASLLLAVVVLGFIVPAFNTAHTYAYTSAYGEALRRPWMIPLIVISPVVKLRTMVLWLAPFLFLPLRSPICLLLLPFVITRFLSSSPTHWGTVFHYSAPLAPILAMATADGLARLAATSGIVALRAAPATTIAAIAMVVLSAVLPGNQPLWRVFRPGHYQETAFHAAGSRAVAMVPTHASVVAQAAVVPHLSQRDRIYVLAASAPDADVVVAARGVSTWPASSFDDIEKQLDARRARGWITIYDAHGWTVLRRGVTR